MTNEIIYASQKSVLANIPITRYIETMQIEHLKTADLIPYARNAKLHSEQQIGKIAGSIKEFGFCNPILIDAGNGIIAGHGRVQAAQVLKLETVPCIRLAHLSDTQRRAYILADNKLAEIGGGWDSELLALEIRDLADGIDLTLAGFDVGEMGDILLEPNFEPGTEDDQGKLDELSPVNVKCPHCQKEFNAREQM
jgi:ParB-like chromosome segregation protein Spo0J